MIIEIPPNWTLLRAVVNHPDRFYNQDWYRNQEFANKDISGKWDVQPNGLFPAGVWAYCYIHEWIASVPYYNYVWTSDVDDMGDRVYIGKACKGGFQIHRHLTIRPEMFINRIDE